MKIVNICLSGTYNEGWGYQDNLITKYQKKNGNDVTIITSRFVSDKNSEKFTSVPKKTWIDSNGIKVIRLDFAITERFSYYFRNYIGLYKSLVNEKPDFIFIHSCQFIDIFEVIKYAKKNISVKICVDNHADFSNSAKTKFSKFVHKTLWKKCAQSIDKYAVKFYGVMPSRVDFLVSMYGIDRRKIDLLVMGADDELVNDARNCRKIVRFENGISDSDFCIITGGKIDVPKKDTINLMKAVNNIGNANIKLYIFGSIVPELREEFDSNIGSCVYLGWLNQEETYKYIAMCDLAVYPGRHSVLWEQTVGLGIPAIFKKWEGTSHVNVGANSILVEDTSVENLENVILDLYSDDEKYEKMKESAENEGMKEFSYKDIAKRSLEIFK